MHRGVWVSGFSSFEVLQNVLELSEISNVDISFGVVACEHCGVTASDKSLQFQIQTDLACMKVFMSSIHPKHGLTKVTTRM